MILNVSPGLPSHRTLILGDAVQGDLGRTPTVTPQLLALLIRARHIYKLGLGQSQMQMGIGKDKQNTAAISWTGHHRAHCYSVQTMGGREMECAVAQNRWEAGGESLGSQLGRALWRKQDLRSW